MARDTIPSQLLPLRDLDSLTVFYRFLHQLPFRDLSSDLFETIDPDAQLDPQG